MGAKSHKLLVNGDLVSPDSALGKQSVLVGSDLGVLEEGADLCLKLVTVANDVLCGDLLYLVGISLYKLKLCLKIVFQLLTLATSHLVVACNSLVKNRLKDLPLCLKVLLRLIEREDLLISRYRHNADVVGKAELISEAAERRKIALKVGGVKTNVANARGVVIHGDENVNLCSAHRIGADVLLNTLLKEDIRPGKLYVTIEKSGVNALDLDGDITDLALALCTAKGCH